ncbi:MAG: FAD-dependent monooxygenase [Gemmatimonadaceae bacterium]
MTLDHSVLIAGGGPTGLVLAAELAIANVDVAIVERRATQEVEGARARGLYARTLEFLDMRGVVDRFVAEGTKYPAVHVHPTALNITDLPTRHNYTLGLLQGPVERILADWVMELGVPFYRSREVTGFTQDEHGIAVTVSDGKQTTTMRAKYLVGCDGGRSTVRKHAGIAFTGSDATTSWIIAEVRTTEPPPYGFRDNDTGTHAIGPADGGLAGMVLTERLLRLESERTLDDLRNELRAVYGSDFGVHTPRWISSFNDATRQAASYRAGRVFLAGDAAHVHAPHGGQGLNLGVGDAMNLGWKLGQVVRGESPDAFLDTYHAERHPVGARVLRNNLTQVALARTDDRTKAIKAVMTELLGTTQARQLMATEMTGLGVRYDVGEGHPLLGARMPDLDLVVSGEPVRMFELLRDGRPVVLNFSAAGRIDATAWGDRVRVIDATCDATWALPAMGSVDAPSAVVVRPDGYIAAVGDLTLEGVDQALGLRRPAAKSE